MWTATTCNRIVVATIATLLVLCKQGGVEGADAAVVEVKEIDRVMDDDVAAFVNREEAPTKEQEEEFVPVMDGPSTLELFPLDKKDDFDSAISNTTSSSASCKSHSTCKECKAASLFCHWCDSDNACHAKGSVHGCFSGSSCSQDDKKKHDDKDISTGCKSHMTCSECADSSSLCHWCAHDNACHAVGSYYGCLTGVDCYSNSRCQRSVPEAISHVDFPNLVPEVGMLPVAMICSVAAILGCCLSACFCFASSVKNAYDDVLLDDDDDDMSESVNEDSSYLPSPQRSQQQSRDPVQTLVEAETEQTHVTVNVTVNTPPQTNDGTSGPTTTSHEQDTSSTDYVRMPDEEEQQGEAMPLISSPDDDQHHHSPQTSHRSRRRPRRGGIQRLYNFCTMCYVASLFVIGGIALATYEMLPLAPPSYNVCSEESDWKSLIESMSTDFEILASVANPNHVSFALDQVNGNFTHKGNPVGTFKLAPVVIQPMAITDILMIAHFAPEKWDAISIGREFVRGKLSFMANVTATLRIPILLDYSITASKQDIVIHVNQLGDRSLCGCSEWNQNKTAKHNNNNNKSHHQSSSTQKEMLIL